MVGYSLRLALSAGGLGLVMVATAQLQATRAALVIALVAIAVAALRWWRTSVAWHRPEVRTRALLTTAFG